MESERLNEIFDLIEEISGIRPSLDDTDIYEELGVTGDDFHELIGKYTEKYHVDMSSYLWYFHTNTEGGCFGEAFKTPPHQEINRIAVTPKMLSKFSQKRKWGIEYPPHSIHESRQASALTFIAWLAALAVLVRTFIDY